MASLQHKDGKGATDGDQQDGLPGPDACHEPDSVIHRNQRGGRRGLIASCRGMHVIKHAQTQTHKRECEEVVHSLRALGVLLRDPAPSLVSTDIQTHVA